MALQVIGAGLGRTGTLTLKTALEALGFGPCHHMLEVFANPDQVPFWNRAAHGELVEWDEVFAGYNASVDWPSCHFYAVLAERYPDAKVILSVRDPERWYESVRNTIYELGVVLPRHPIYRIGYKLVSLFVLRGSGNVDLAGEIIWQGTFDGRFEDKHHAIEVFNRHNEEVQRRVPQEQLLVYEVKEGWGPLCAFLGVEEPDKPFPRLNDTAEMRSRILKIRAISIAVPAALALLGMLALLARRT